MYMIKQWVFLILLFSCNALFSQLISENKTNFDTSFDNIYKQDKLNEILHELPNNKELQFERLLAYFFHQRINQYRFEKGLTTLYWDDRMWLAARNHNLYQWKLQQLSHDEIKGKPFFTGIKSWDRIQYVTSNKFKLDYYAENCLFYTDEFYSFETDDAIQMANRAFEQWKKSPGHNTNMLDPKHFAHGTSFIIKGDYLYATTNFGNASDFIENEISITWNDSLAKLYLPDKIQNRKTYSSSK